MIPRHGRLDAAHRGQKRALVRPISANLTHEENEHGATALLDESSVALTFDDVLLVPRPSDVLPARSKSPRE
jgi:hypothetical protein